MPNITKKLGLNILLENDIVNFEQINENFQKIDDCVICTESGIKTASSVLDSVMFRVMAMEYEDDYIYKQVYITVKGVIDNV